jgi:hypothetical protein
MKSTEDSKDRLWALKTDVDPFRRVFFGISAIGVLLRITRCTLYRCPYCRWIFKATWGPTNSLLGSGDRICWHCRKTFRDSSNEWPEMSGEDQRLFLLPITIMGFIGAFALIAALVLWTSLSSKNPTHFEYRLFSLIFGVPLSFWFGFRGWQIVRSIHRYNDRGRSRPI